MFYIVKTSANREQLCADLILNKIKKLRESNDDLADKIKSIIYVPDLKGYIFVESDDEAYVARIIHGLSHVKGMLYGRPVPSEDIEKFFEEKDISKEIKKGDIVEITSGPFKGEKGKVIRIDSSKNNVTVEIINAVVPIPVTISGMYIRKVSSDGREDE